MVSATSSDGFLVQRVTKEKRLKPWKQRPVMLRTSVVS